MVDPAATTAFAFASVDEVGKDGDALVNGEWHRESDGMIPSCNNTIATANAISSAGDLGTRSDAMLPGTAIDIDVDVDDDDMDNDDDVTSGGMIASSPVSNGALDESELTRRIGRFAVRISCCIALGKPGS